ncbi:exodeoxyribonuclease V subunit gamma [Pedobacter psychrophilus]|uniref:RecBCD enzyme subunit RecC n=1 Tax=Pedobacter psychrophilus TaxID=1826909 RepID=A0A179DF90_9SPHI|nr:exodeoxyribonuclease V subunit gamma [Pedobacter psychrophilus]OAQ39717.1 exodeoxyribonuclease V subunit gamma [Pedobacter psychrophilus]
MSVSLKVSNSLAQLALQFCEDLKSKKTGIFQPYNFITQTEGMNNWLKLQLANHLKIAANYRFLKPNDLVAQIYHILGGEYLQPLSPENQSWLIFKILGEESFINKFKNISQYYDEENLDKDLKRLALAQKIADLFDQYQIYRPEMIKLWNQSTVADIGFDEWQKYIWIKAKELAEKKFPDKTYMSDYILEALKTPQNVNRLTQKMPDIYLFGLSVLTDFHIQLFHVLGQHINFFYYLLNPAPEQYWIEDISKKRAIRLQDKYQDEDYYQSEGNTLLTNWGKVIQSTFFLLFKNEEMLNAYEVIENQIFENKSLLHIIQNEIYENLDDQDRKPLNEALINDGSISINSCFTPAREVEALYNYLVSLVDKGDKKLSPRDIVVMVSDIDTYASYIKAVFKNAPYKFNFSIADESFTSNDTIVAALIGLMELNSHNLTAENVLQLLDFGYIRKRFGITDLTLIRKIVNQANIRFGIEGSLEDESVYVSWKYGLERIIFGICISGSEEYETENHTLFPLDMVEGSAAEEIIRFVHFAEVLIASIQQRERNRNLTDWVKYVENILTNLIFDTVDNVDEDYNLLIKQLEKYNSLNELLIEPLSFQLFNYNLLQSLSASTKTGSFAGGGITFCSLIPMRSIPFKVVALLGLNYDKFPRKEHPVDFDLIKQHPKLGDRNVKDNDKHLFLETILSAQEKLYLSYIGQNDKDNTSIPPSALIDELLDYLQNKYENDDLASQMIIKHPLHNFSDKNNELNRLNYLIHVPLKDYDFFQKQAKTKDLELTEININSFINFFKNPFKAYYQKVLNIYYEDEDLLLGDTEAFELDSLQQWNLKQNLLLAKADDLPILKNRLLKTGGLPLKNMADLVIKDLDEKVRIVRELLNQTINNEDEKSLPINVELRNGSILSGNISGVYGDKLIFISWSKKENKGLLEAYIIYLAAQASGLNLSLYFISANNEKAYKSQQLNSAEAKEKLNEMFKLYHRGLNDILCFYPSFEVKIKDIPYNYNYQKFKKAVNDKLNSYLFPSTDKYIMNKYNDGYFDSFPYDETNEIYQEFVKNNEILLSPIVSLLPDYYA